MRLQVHPCPKPHPRCALACLGGLFLSRRDKKARNLRDKKAASGSLDRLDAAIFKVGGTAENPKVRNFLQCISKFRIGSFIKWI